MPETADQEPGRAAAASGGVRYKRSRFTTRLPADFLYTAAHMWLARDGEAGTWRVGFTKFAVRMLGEVVESGFEVKPGAALAVGQVIGWLEGFKASTDLYCALSGEFIAPNPLLATQADRIHADPYGDGWLYRARGLPDSAALDMQGYVGVLDRAIDKIQGDEPHHHEESPA
jgi:glycine cleavage system H protein